MHNRYHRKPLFSKALDVAIQQLLEKIGNSNNLRTLLSFVYMDALAAEILNDPKTSNVDYIFSRTLCRLLLKKYSKIDGLIFPSAKHDRAFNIAIKPEPFLKKQM